ncbi:hypothetical protein AX15_005210 [Amanita polypyramis BW_CC]|nr:hypothetical protein AX15_005210 [Amanita polypyramis BW_CC]
MVSHHGVIHVQLWQKTDVFEDAKITYAIKKEGLAMLGRRRARSAKGSVTARLHASLARIGAIAKKVSLTILGRRHARSGSNSLAAPAEFHEAIGSKLSRS